MARSGREIELLEQISQFIPGADRTIFKVLLDESPTISGVSYIKDRVVEDLDLAEELQPLLTELARLKKTEIEEDLEPGQRKPKLMVLDVHESGRGERLAYDDSNAYSISKADLGKSNSYYVPGTIILPDTITNALKDAFCADKEIDSLWTLCAFGRASEKLSLQRIKWDHRLRFFRRSSVEKWLMEMPEKSRFSDLARVTGLQLSLFKDGTFYDEAINKGLSIEWVNNDGEFNNYHTVAHGKVSAFNGSMYLLPTEHSDIGSFSKEEKAYVRYNDYDTTVTDTIAIDKNTLYRSVAVVTDGIYLDRFLYQYERLDHEFDKHLN